MFNTQYNMVESKVTKIGGTHFARIPADEAKRLGLKDGSPVELDVRPLRRSAQDVLTHKGAFRGALRPHAKEDLWGEG